jgi:hypothetical protein
MRVGPVSVDPSRRRQILLVEFRDQSEPISQVVEREAGCMAGAPRISRLSDTHVTAGSMGIDEITMCCSLG